MADDGGALLNEVGCVLAQDTAYPLEGTFLYVEAEYQMVDISIFKDLGDHLLFRLSMPDLADVLLKLWEAETPKKRWTAMEYLIDGGTFSASFTFDKLDPGVSTIKRRQAILDRRYGNKRIVYPSIR